MQNEYYIHKWLVIHIMFTFTFTWSYTFIFILIYHCSIWTLTSINNTNCRADYRLSSVTCLMTTRVWSTFSSNLSFDGASYIEVTLSNNYTTMHSWYSSTFIDCTFIWKQATKYSMFSVCYDLIIWSSQTH